MLKLFIIWICFQHLGVLAQNLVQNHGFELYNKCPKSFSKGVEDFEIPNWYSPTGGTPDYFNSCMYENKVNLHETWAGQTIPPEGNGYVGIYLIKYPGQYSEYIQVKLSERLEKGVSYKVGFQYMLATESHLFVNSYIGVLLSDTGFVFPLKSKLEFIPDKVLNKELIFNVEDMNWNELEYEFVAKGTEAFLTIGNFTPQSQILFIEKPFWNEKYYQPMLYKAAYFYIDDVEVVRTDYVSKIQPDDDVDLVFELDSTLVFDQIQFHFNSSELTIEAKDYLNIIVDYLVGHNKISLIIEGHTDDIGDSFYNDKLSMDRAFAVKAYLVEKLVNKERIEIVGLGESLPISDDISEESRRINRRVEFVFKDLSFK